MIITGSTFIDLRPVLQKMETQLDELRRIRLGVQLVTDEDLTSDDAVAAGKE